MTGNHWGTQVAECSCNNKYSTKSSLSELLMLPIVQFGLSQSKGHLLKRKKGRRTGSRRIWSRWTENTPSNKSLHCVMPLIVAASSCSCFKSNRMLNENFKAVYNADCLVWKVFLEARWHVIMKTSWSGQHTRHFNSTLITSTHLWQILLTQVLSRLLNLHQTK